MSAHMSTEKALTVIDLHVARPRRQGTLGSTHGRRATARKTPGVLPAFQVGGWREGPSPYDLHTGTATCGVDDVWASRQGIAVEDKTVDGAVGHLIATAGATAGDGSVVAAAPLARVCEGVCGGHLTCSGLSDRFASDTRPATLVVEERAEASKGAASLAVGRNPARDRRVLDHTMRAAAGRSLVERLGGDRSALYASCVRNHPYGALGIREAPYAVDAGDVYGAHGQRLRVARAHDTRKLLGYAVSEPQGHLKGPIVVRDTPNASTRMHVAHIAPRDHLLGGVNVD